MTVSEARNAFSDVVNRAAFGGDITYITRGRSRRGAAAVVPAELAELIENLLDANDASEALARLEELRSGKSVTVSLSEVKARLGM